MASRVLVGDCREMLRTLEADSVACCVTSPPYWGLRAYGTNPQVWGGDPDCEHLWAERSEYHNRGDSTAGAKQKTSVGAVTGRGVIEDASCPCGAWRGELGSEPTVEQYVRNLVDVFREVRRALHPTGTLWLNLGSSYAGSGKGPSNSLSRPCSILNNRQLDAGAAPTTWQGVAPGFKSKDLILAPFFVAEALRQDGWWLRACLPWVKRNSMPESVVDRPSSAVEYVFLLAKSSRYFWDAEAVRRGGEPYRVKQPDGWDTSPGAHGTVHRNGREQGTTRNETRSGRSFRNSDLFYDSLGLILSEDDEPIALDVNPAGYPGAHFATYPVRLIEPLIRASSSEKGCCPTCSAPWRRVVERGHPGDRGKVIATYEDQGVLNRRMHPGAHHAAPSKHVGWAQSCRCAPAEPIPCTVLDPFSGSGTTGLVASRLGRDYIGCELNPAYAAMSEARINSDEVLFSERVQVEAPADFVPVPLFAEVAV